MKFGIDLLARLGLFAPKTVNTAPDAFDMRLERQRTREARQEVRFGLFRNQPSH